MLTTLLVVRRWIGELPPKRVELYRESVKVLIRTWNTEGFAPMDLDETLAQLSYVACVMMNEGLQQIGHRRLLKLLQAARTEMPEELQFTKISPAEFIERVEYRSSLLMQTGHERIDEELQPVYEFRHLTFQEYLAARGLIEEQYPGRDQGLPLVELLAPHFEEERWREVIPLAAVLAGRKAEPLIQRLTVVCESRKLEHGYSMREDVNAPAVVLLRQCLLDEVQVAPVTLRAALRQMGRFSVEELAMGSIVSLRRGRFGDIFLGIVEEAYLDGGDHWAEYTFSMRDLTMDSIFHDQKRELSIKLSQSLLNWLNSKDRLSKARAAAACQMLAYLNCSVPSYADEASPTFWQRLAEALGRLLTTGDSPLVLTATYALIWVGRHRLIKAPIEPTILCSLFRLWRDADSELIRRNAAAALYWQPLLSRSAFGLDTWGECDAWLQECRSGDNKQAAAALVVAWYRRRPWNDLELAKMASELPGDLSGPTRTMLMAAMKVPAAIEDEDSP